MLKRLYLAISMCGVCSFLTFVSPRARKKKPERSLGAATCPFGSPLCVDTLAPCREKNIRIRLLRTTGSHIQYQRYRQLLAPILRAVLSFLLLVRVVAGIRRQSITRRRASTDERIDPSISLQSSGIQICSFFTSQYHDCAIGIQANSTVRIGSGVSAPVHPKSIGIGRLLI